ncbi:MAG: hypothetical protein PVH25_05920 [Burkholderiales bacterium]|jgi:hypothetical protein
MFHFSFRQYILLGVGLLLILLAVSLNRITELWDATVNDHTVAWHRLAISPGKNTYVSSLDESMLVLRSSSGPDARLTLFTRKDDGSTPEDLVRDLCGRDSCEFSPLEDARLDGAIADYASGAPLRFVLMHPAGSAVWLEYKGPPDGLSAFDELIDTIVIQLQATAGSSGAS